MREPVEANRILRRLLREAFERGRRRSTREVVEEAIDASKRDGITWPDKDEWIKRALGERLEAKAQQIRDAWLAIGRERDEALRQKGNVAAALLQASEQREEARERLRRWETERKDQWAWERVADAENAADDLRSRLATEVGTVTKMTGHPRFAMDAIGKYWRATRMHEYRSEARRESLIRIAAEAVAAVVALDAERKP